MIDSQHRMVKVIAVMSIPLEIHSMAVRSTATASQSLSLDRGVPRSTDLQQWADDGVNGDSRRQSRRQWTKDRSVRKWPVEKPAIRASLTYAERAVAEKYNFHI